MSKLVTNIRKFLEFRGILARNARDRAGCGGHFRKTPHIPREVDTELHRIVTSGGVRYAENVLAGARRTADG
jgi:hypothetical protein